MSYRKWRSNAKDKLKHEFKSASKCSEEFYVSLKSNLFDLLSKEGIEKRREQWHTYKSICENVSFLDMNLSTAALMIAILSIALDNFCDIKMCSVSVGTLALILMIVALVTGVLAIVMDYNERKFKYMSQVLDDLKESIFDETNLTGASCKHATYKEKNVHMKKKDYFPYIAAIRTLKDGKISGGTGFFIKTQNGNEYLVTAAHIASTTTAETDIWLRNSTTGNPFFIKLHELNSMGDWVYHSAADIAILAVLQNDKLDLSSHVLEQQFFEKNFSNVPGREEELTMYGMPDVYIDLEFAPFTCDSRPASNLWVAHFDMTGQDFKCFMLDKPSIQGFSGGPVILNAKDDKPKCYGIVHGTRPDNTGGKLAVVVHSAYLFELINLIESNNNGPNS